MSLTGHTEHDLTIGLFGLGAFGRIAGAALSAHATVLAHDPVREAEPPLRGVTPDEAAACPVVVLAVPVPRLGDALGAIAPHLRPGTLVVDVASVKVGPVRLMLERVPEGCDVLGTHPLFGPQTVEEKGLAGQPIALCPARIDADRLGRVRGFLEGVLGLRTFEVDPDEHDRQMALVQVITHLIGHAAVEMDLPELPLATLAYRRLLQMKRNTQGDSPELFAAIQRENPYAAEARQRFLDALEAVRRRADG